MSSPSPLPSTVLSPSSSMFASEVSRGVHARVFSGEIEVGDEPGVRQKCYGLVQNIRYDIRLASERMGQIDQAIEVAPQADKGSLLSVKAIFARQKALGEQIVLVGREHAESFAQLTQASPVTVFQRIRAVFTRKLTEEEG